MFMVCPMFNKSIWFCGEFAIFLPPNEIHLMYCGVGHFVILIHATLLTDQKSHQFNAIASNHMRLCVFLANHFSFLPSNKSDGKPKNEKRERERQLNVPIHLSTH